MRADRRSRRHLRSGRPGRSGQALVEFALALPIFLLLMMAVFDLGRAIYMYNGVRRGGTRAGPGHERLCRNSTLGEQRQRPPRSWRPRRPLVPKPGRSRPSSAWISTDRYPASPKTYKWQGMQVKVVIIAPYAPVTPVLSLVGTIDLKSSSTFSIQQ